MSTCRLCSSKDQAAAENMNIAAAADCCSKVAEAAVEAVACRHNRRKNSSGNYFHIHKVARWDILHTHTIAAETASVAVDTAVAVVADCIVESADCTVAAVADTDLDSSRTPSVVARQCHHSHHIRCCR